jgi:diguanylate cyclase (GGDEF)-like protein/PAS domain S-box-containing protein
MKLQSLRSAWWSFSVGITYMYSALDAEAAQIRGNHLSTVKRLTPATMAANAGSASLVLWAFWDSTRPLLLLWWLGLLGLSVATTVAWVRSRHRVIVRASPRAVRRVTWHSALLSGMWAVAVVGWFPGGSLEQQVILSTLVTGMIGAGTFVLNPLPLASLVYAAIFSLASFLALWLSGNPRLAGVAVLICFYSPTVVVGSLFAWRKSTQVFRAKSKAIRQERMLAVLLQDFEEHAGEALWETDSAGNLSHLSARFLELLGLAHDDAEKQSLATVLAIGSPTAFGAISAALLAGRPFQSLDLEFHLGTEVRHLLVSGKRFLDTEGVLQGWRGVLVDVTEKVEGERRLRLLAHTDSLTGLANRFMFRDRLVDALQQKARVAVLFIDLDHFKAVNDSLGHSAGDEVLAAVAQRFIQVCSPSDLLARIGGDEFAVLLQHQVSEITVNEVAKQLIHALKAPLVVRGRNLKVGASIGGAVSDGAEMGLDEFLVQSDAALYAAKASGRGQFTLYSREIGEAGRRRILIEEGLRVAIATGQVELHWQPKVNVVTGAVVSAEALMRWSHPELGCINPVEFIAIAEQCGLIDELGQWALVHACESAEKYLSGLSVAVNVSPVQLQGEDIVRQVQHALQVSGLEPSRLELEITESVFMDGAEGAFEKLFALRALGVKIALDDFGTGYSSLAYLRRFPFDTLKIDRSFVMELMQSKDARAIVLMISQLAARLGMHTVAEGIETQPQLAAVAQAGCDEIQGHLVSPALPMVEFLQFALRWRSEMDGNSLYLEEHRFSESTFV